MDNNKKESIIKKSVRDELGMDYQRVLTWYHILHSDIKFMKDEHYQEMLREWKIFNSVSSMVEFNVETKENVLIMEDQYLDKTFRLFSYLLNGPKTSLSDEDKRKYILESIELFKHQVSTETLHKESISLLKMSMDDIEFDASGNAIFNSGHASTYIGDNIDVKHNGSNMRWVGSSEDGISRLLKHYGLSQVIVFMGNVPKTDEEVLSLHQAKVNIFKNGIIDIATGKHYMCSAPSASSTRHADFPFIEAETPMDVFKIWCEITGFKTIEDLIAGIGHFKDGRYVVNLAKLKARIAMRGSNSFDTYKLTSNENVLFRLKHPNVDYVRDAKGETSIPYKGISSPGILEMKNPDGSVTTERV